MHEINVENPKSTPWLKLIASVVEGDEIVFTQNDQPIAKLIAYPGKKGHPQFGSAKGTISLADDFDEPLEDFEEYR